MSKRALKSGIWYTACNFFVKGAGFLTMPIFTRLMSPDEIGDFTNLMSWIIILTIVATFELGTSIGVARFDFKDDLDNYMASNLLLGSIITLAFYVFCLIFKDFALSVLSFSELELHVAFLYLLVCPALQMFQGWKQIMYEYKMSVALSMASLLSATLTSMVCVLYAEDKLFARIIGYYGPLFLLNIVIYAYILKKAKKVNTRYWKYAVRIAAPLIVHMLAGNLLNSSDRVMIKNMVGAEAAALYSVSHAAAVVVQVLWQSMNSAWAPWVYEMMNKENYAAIRKVSKPYTIFFVFAAFCFLLIGPEMLWIMGGESYMRAVVVIPPVVVAFVCQFVYSLYVNIEFYYKKQHYIAMGTIFAAALNISLNYLFIPKFGYVAAAYTTLAGYLALFISHYLFTCRMKKNHIYDTKFNFGVIFLFLGLMLLVYVLYQFTMLRYLVMGLVFVASVVAGYLLRRELLYALKVRSLKPIMEILFR